MAGRQQLLLTIPVGRGRLAIPVGRGRLAIPVGRGPVTDGHTLDIRDVNASVTRQVQRQVGVPATGPVALPSEDPRQLHFMGICTVHDAVAGQVE